jgi:hypothetical protein
MEAMLWKKPSTPLKHSLHGADGQAAVEFALTLMTTMLLIFGLIDFGRAVYAAAVVQWAAQEGARAGIINLADVEPAVLERMVSLDTEEVTIITSDPAPNTVAVDVTYRFFFVTPLISSILGEGLELQSSASMVTQPPPLEGSGP